MGKHKIYTSEDGTYKFILGYDKELRINKLDKMPDDRYLLALKRLRKYVEAAPFIPDDSDETGYKHTHCSWGLCCDEIEVYPDKQDYIWPEREPIDGKVNVIEHGKCPHNLRQTTTLKGCFFTCAYRKQLETGSKKADRKQALDRIDKRIKQVDIHAKDK